MQVGTDVPDKNIFDVDLNSSLDDLVTRAKGLRTSGIGISDVKGLENAVFEAGSTKVRGKLGVEPTPGPIKAPYDYDDPDFSAFVRHAEEEFGNQFIAALSKAGYKSDGNGVISGASGNARFHMNASQVGVCNHCLLNLRTPSKSGNKGVVQQLSEKVPNVKFVFETRGHPDKTIVIQGGRLIDETK
jgi:hypothetical protein